MDQVCPVCRQQQQSWSHLCLEQRDVVHAEMYRDFLQNSNPLDRLPNNDYMDQTDSSNHVTLWDGSNYKRAA